MLGLAATQPPVLDDLHQPGLLELAEVVAETFGGQADAVGQPFCPRS